MSEKTDEVLENEPLENENDNVNENENGGVGESGDENWRESIKDEKLRKHSERFNTVEDAVKNSLDLRKKLSNAIVKPGKDASEEDIKSFRKAMDVPESIEDYTFPEVEEMTDEIKESRERWGKLFQENNISKEAMKSIVTAYQEDLKAAEEAKAEADKEFSRQSEQELRDEWKGDFDKNLKIANKAASNILGEAFEDARQLETKDGKYILDHPVFVRMFAKIGREMGEANIGGNLTDSERADAESKIDEVRQKRMEAHATGNAKAAKRYDEEERILYAKLYGNEPVR